MIIIYTILYIILDIEVNEIILCIVYNIYIYIYIFVCIYLYVRRYMYKHSHIAMT